MNVSCPACATEYIVDQPDERNFHGNTARMRCGACDTVWLVSRVAEPETSPQLQQARPASDRAHAAVVRRGTAREKRDLFATRDPELGSVKQTLRPAPFSSGVAARNETSVLFTIDSLKSAAAQKTPPPPPPPMTNSAPSGRPDDDDGLIDLKALSSVPPRGAPNASQPLFTSEPPPGAFARELSSPGSLLPLVRKRPTAKLIGAIAGGVVATALMVVGIAVAFRGEEPAKNVATASIAAAKPVIPAPVVAPPPPAPEPAAAPAAKEEEAKPVAAGKKGKGGKGKVSRPSPASGLQKVGSSGVAAKSEAAPAPKPAARSADACGCKGNFDCIIRCSAKGK
ncbi:hypothetical protein AKJ09_08337 [Labilithrix luteola]|uniref:Zinc finger/thioredoxin putative domain-containing protein n=1 Tax=Labilithrix luteola TaxID=1391654 RepID=A0A0K1Q7G7_9BACT|nr:MJ0042-type zinc finger domain-containing protein [Labilithrix luteola]AKV01674.1 hypothetical protein AKJ09_08337 [Labilithrix luteola]